MTIQIQQGSGNKTVVLDFYKGGLPPAGVPVAAPSSGGHVSSTSATTCNATLGTDQKTVTLIPGALGTATISYTGPSGSSIVAAPLTVIITATTADTAQFDESSLADVPPS